MRSSLRVFIPAAVALVAAAALPDIAQAQSISEFSIGAGIMDYDLSGTGNTITANVRTVMPLSSTFVLEPGVVYARPDLQGGGGATLLIPEVQLQAQLPLGFATPYLGAGVGAQLAFVDDGADDQDIAFSAAAGVRIDAGGLLGFVVDGRIHGFGTEFTGSTAELTLGLRIRR